MDRFLAYFGGLLGGYAIVMVPLSGAGLGFLHPIVHLIGTLAMLTFAGAMIVSGVRYMLRK
ncbi:hypothetical protein [Paenibacillus sp. YYML68]|uniref:hypothetical protein n=1 Tax=Paenibacillus sp. YYML68 TaxID=2909250 RepID=UPI0024901AC9|nr:hypothetical protein [Paenibacillus sp. YYML68]